MALQGLLHVREGARPEDTSPKGGFGIYDSSGSNFAEWEIMTKVRYNETKHDDKPTLISQIFEALKTIGFLTFPALRAFEEPSEGPWATLDSASEGLRRLW